MGLNETASEERRTLLWDSFLARWPLEKLSELTLGQYTQAGTQDSFTYWLESRTEDLGSVWGGSSFKFGIYHRKNRKPTASGDGRTYTDEYAWFTKYGATAQQAFQAVRDLIVGVARAARTADLKAIDEIDLGEVIKWKTAFLYQNRASPCILPIFKALHLRAFLGSDSARQPMSTLQKRVMATRGEEPLFEFAQKAWTTASERLRSGSLTPAEAFDYLKERFQLVREPTDRMAGFTTTSGEPLALVRDAGRVVLFLGPGDWNRKGVRIKKTYGPQDTRNGQLSSHAPALCLGASACKVEVQTMAALESLCDDYDNTDERPTVSATPHLPASLALNRILYGPPGTGKTFHAITEALRVLDPDYLQQHSADRPMLKKRFDELVSQNRARVVTFHQSFTYEDFVEGIRAVSDPEKPGVITYDIEKGIFRKLCEDAHLASPASAQVGIKPDAKVWKLSIGRRHDLQIREECFRRGEARIGWGRRRRLA